MTEAAFRATYSDWKVIKGRKVVQVIFELPLEAADSAYQALGGMPIAASEVWCGIARLKPESEVVPSDDGRCSRTSGPGTRPVASGQNPSPAVAQPQPNSTASSAGAEKRKSPAQIAGYLCTLPSFQRCLMANYNDDWWHCRELFSPDIDFEEIAAEVVRLRCDVKSRTDITEDNPGWREIVSKFHTWEKEAEVVPA